METKAQKFKRVANKRLKKALKSIEVLKACSNAQWFEYTKEQVDKIESVMNDAMRGLIDEFRIGLDDPEEKDEKIL